MNEKMQEKMYEEAIKRLELLVEQGMSKEMLESYKEKGASVTVPINMGGFIMVSDDLFTNKKEYNDIKEDFEKKYDCKVYMGTFNKSSYGDMLTLLFVSEDKKEWKMDKKDLAEGYPIAYVYNLQEKFGELGTVVLKVCDNRVIRVG